VARIVALIPDLLFGSNVVGALRGAGHEPILLANADSLEEDLIGADALVVDLTADAPQRIAEVSQRRREGVPVLAFYSHVEADVRREAEQAGFERVVPRSRMAREGPALLTDLIDGPAGA
jgi:uncharacterized protein YbjT (DUF2867 family)